MTPNRVTEKSYPNSQTLKEGIEMMFKQFGHRIGAALALSVAFWLVIGAVSESVAQAQQFSINPNSGATTAPGRTQFQVNGQLQGSGVTWTCQIQAAMTPAGITVAFIPGVVTVSPFRNGGQASSTANVNVAAGVAAGTYQLNVVVNCSGANGGQPVQWGQAFVYTLQVTGAGPPLGPCQFNFAFEPPVGNLIQVQNTQDPMAWAWAANVTIVSTAQGNCPATSRFTARLAFNSRGSFMMQPEVSGAIPGRYGTTIMARNSASIGAGYITTAVIEICASEGGNRPWRCQNYNYQLRRGGSSPGPGSAPTPPPAPAPIPSPAGLAVQLAVDRGCGAAYQIGDPLTVTFTVSQDALATLSLIMPDGSQRVLVANQPVRAGVPNSIQGMVGEPAGQRTLILDATAGQARGRAECAFTAGGGSAPLPPATPSPIAQLQAFITTDRGCQETGENPIYSVGEQITVSFRVDGVAQAFVTIENIMASGERQIIFQQIVPGNQLLQLTGQIVPPTGRETLRLTAQVDGQSVVSECSFTSQ